MSERKLEAIKKEIRTLLFEISKLKDESAELSLREGTEIPQQQSDIEVELGKKEAEMRSLEKIQRGLSLRLEKLPELRTKIREIEKRAEELNERGLKAVKTLEKHRQKVKEDINNLREIVHQFHQLRALANEIKKEVDSEEAPNISSKKDFTPPTNAVYFAENRGIVTRW